MDLQSKFESEVPKYRHRTRKRRIPVYYRLRREYRSRVPWFREWAVLKRYVTVDDAEKAVKVLNAKDKWFEYSLDPY